jgi:hypothetical protein
LVECDYDRRALCTLGHHKLTTRATPQVLYARARTHAQSPAQVAVARMKSPRAGATTGGRGACHDGRNQQRDAHKVHQRRHRALVMAVVHELPLGGLFVLALVSPLCDEDAHLAEPSAYSDRPNDERVDGQHGAALDVEHDAAECVVVEVAELPHLVVLFRLIVRHCRPVAGSHCAWDGACCSVLLLFVVVVVWRVFVCERVVQQRRAAARCRLWAQLRVCASTRVSEKARRAYCCGGWVDDE